MIGNGIDLRRFEEIRPVDLRRELAAPRETPIGVMVSTVRRAKGIELLLDAAARSGFRTRMRIAVIGREADARYARECLERRTRLGLDGCVVFLGERSDVAGLLHGADFGLLSSRRESGPLVLAEYLACGLPFISTRVGGLGHRVAELGVPDFVPPGQPEAFARAIDRLLELPEAERRTRGERGREIAREHLDIRRLMPAWYDLYQSAASSAARPGS